MSSKSNHLNRIADFVMAILLVASIVSQSLVDLCLATLFILLFFKWRSDKSQFKFVKIPFLVFMFGYLAVAFIGLWNNLGISQMPWGQIGKFIWIFNLAILVIVFVNLSLDWIRILKWAAVFSLVPSVYGLTTYFIGYDYLTKMYISRIVGLVNSATYHAHAGGILFVLLSGLTFQFWKNLSRWMQILLIFCLLSLLTSVWVTYTRGIWLALVASTFWILLIYKPRLSAKFVGIAFLIFLISYQGFENFKSRVDLTFHSSTTSDRVDLFNVNVEMFQDYPLLGIGYGQNRERNREYWDKPHWNRPAEFIISHAHNQYLNVLATTGVVGLSLFSIFFFGLYARLFKFKKLGKELIECNYPSVQVLIWSISFVILACVTDVTFEYAKIRVLVLIIWAASIAYYQNVAKPTT